MSITGVTINDAGACEVTVVGYNAVELNMYTGKGRVKIPESVAYGGKSYRIISLGGESICVISANITSVTIPKTVIFFWDGAFRSKYLENIYVDEENPNFRSHDGVLFTKSLYTLIKYPSANGRTEYNIPDETEEIAYWSFYQCTYLEKLTIGKNVSGVGMANGGHCYHNSKPTSGFGVIGFGGIVITGGFERIMESLAGNGKVIVPEENESYCQIDGIVYDAM